MTLTRTMIGFTLAALALAQFAMAPAALASAPEHVDGKKAVAESQGSRMPVLARMERMARVKAYLYEARGAAEAKGNEIAAARIDEALRLLAVNRTEMHERMVRAIKKMKERQENMAKMQQQCKVMMDKMARKEQARPAASDAAKMKQKMAEMQKKMEQMRKEMESKSGRH